MKHSRSNHGIPLVYSPNYSIRWDPKHRFPMAKYRLLYEHLSRNGIATRYNTYISSPSPHEWLQLAHEPAYIDRFVRGLMGEREQKHLGLVWSEQLVTRTLTAVGGSVQTCRLALRFGLACHLAGGTHHAFADHGNGFCVFNDMAVAARTLLDKDGLKRILILDCDVHQGDGTAHILADDRRVFTCSIHGKTNYPFEKQRSDLDVALVAGTDDATYMAALNQTLDRLEQLGQFDLLIYDAGSDVHQDDRLGQMQLTDQGVKDRDLRVLDWAAKKSLPTACMIGGGYDHNHQRLAERHGLLFETADQFYRRQFCLDS
ncbi:histone deacetylase [Motiliproteus sp.]|uniref:histone deacetylase family protein n=1 Tax=Motiliproteus sp. TaxID=1898955 RepID=UPI003BA91B78